MKRFDFIIMVLLFLTSCSVDTSGIFDNPPIRNDTYFTPPAWIQGEWVGKYTFNGNNGSDSFKFTQNNFIARSIEYNERINWVAEKYFTPTEQISTINYNIKLEGIAVAEIYNFSRISESEITCVFERGDTDDWNNRIVINYTLTRL